MYPVGGDDPLTVQGSLGQHQFAEPGQSRGASRSPDAAEATASAPVIHSKLPMPSGANSTACAYCGSDCPVPSAISRPSRAVAPPQ